MPFRVQLTRSAPSCYSFELRQHVIEFMTEIGKNVISNSRETVLSKDCYFGASYQRGVGKNLLQVCCRRKDLLPLRQIAFGHRSSRSDIAGRMDQSGAVRIRVGSARVCQFGLRQHPEVPSSRQVGHARLRHQWQPVSSRNDQGGDVTSLRVPGFQHRFKGRRVLSGLRRRRRGCLRRGLPFRNGPRNQVEC